MIRRGFTLIELLVVITILAILAGAALPYVQNYVAESRIAKAKTDLEEIARALAVYETREGDYPDVDAAPLDGLTDVGQLTGRYLNKAPIDPWGKPYAVNLFAGTVVSSGPDRSSGAAAGDEYDDISVPYQPPLALVQVKWVDKNQTGAVDDINVADEIHLFFSRKLGVKGTDPDAGAFDETPANVLAGDNDAIDVNTLDVLNDMLVFSNVDYAGGEDFAYQIDEANIRLLANRKVLVLPIRGSVYAATSGNPIVANAFVPGQTTITVNSDPLNGPDAVGPTAAAPGYFYDLAGNKCLTNQPVKIAPQ